MDIGAISAGPNPPKDIHVVIEIPLGGTPVKYELDKKSGALMVDRFLHTAMFYPGNYGFIPQTLSADGDPCDVLVVSQVQVVPGAVVRCRPVGALLMEDEAGGDEKIIAVPVDALASVLHGCAAATAICRRSCASRSRISSSTTRIWKRASGSRSSSGSTCEAAEKLVLDAIARADEAKVGGQAKRNGGPTQAARTSRRSKAQSKR